MKKNLKALKSVQNFKHEIEETQTLMYALETQVLAMRELLPFIEAEKSPEWHKYKKLLEINERQIQKTYELGFVALFANFECFMVDLLKELFKRYPSSVKSERIIKFEDIKDFEKINDIKDYLIDACAIEKSYDIDGWTNFLLQKFGIKIFKNNEDLQRFKGFNSLRNIILHSGSKTNSKFRNEMSSFLKLPVPLGLTFSLENRKKYFNVLHTILKSLIANIEKS